MENAEDVPPWCAMGTLLAERALFENCRELIECVPCGEGSCEVEANSPTATQVEQDLEVCSSLLG